MKVILLTDLKGRGKEGDVIDVARGFARNYLLPRNMAVEATPGNMKQLEARMHNIRKREEVKRAEAEEQAAQVTGKSIVVEAKAGEGGKLYGSVTSGMVADALADQLGVDVDRKSLDLHGHIKTLGEHMIDIRLYEDVSAEVTLKVVPIDGAAETAPAPPAARRDESVTDEAAPQKESPEQTAEADVSGDVSDTETE